MIITSVQSLVVFFCVFGVIGAVRGPQREVWTLVGVALILALLYFAGPTFFTQLPLRLGSGVMSLLGNQDASDGLFKQQVASPWADLILLMALGGLISLAYYMGNRFGGKNDPKDVGERASGFIMGALTGTFIALFVFSQNIFQDLRIQFPNGDQARQGLIPLIVISLIIVVIALSMRRQAAGAPKK